MAGLYGLENMDVIRVKVKKCDGLMQPEYTKFSIDPQITSYDMLQTILASAFNIKGDFAISYLAKDEWKQDVYLSMLSDWDLDAACQGAATPHLKLKVDLKPFEEGLDDWDIIAPVDIPQPKISHLIDRNSFLSSITGTITTRVERTVNQMQKAMKLRPDDGRILFPVKPPMSDMEFRNYQDSNGSLVKPHELRLSIYQGGLETSLRRVVWRHILNIYPEHLSGRERFDYMKKKELEYYKLRDQWKTHFSKGTASEDVKYTASMVKKDVLRTDRTHKFYAGSDENKNVVALFHILVTYALTHPEVSYCQGMSDIASPLLVTQKDEAQAYLCFCGSMKRLKSNFMINGVAMTTKFQHLTLLLQICDPVFYAYLKDCDAHDLFFCYRWLLLELKREFPLDDSLLMLETMWSTLPPDPPETELHLMDPDYVPYSLSNYPSSLSPSFKQTVYAKLMAMRRNPPKSLSYKIQQEKRQINNHNSVNNNSQPSPCDNSPSDDKINSQEYPKFDVAEALKLTARSQSIDISLGQKSSVESSKGGYSCSESDLRDDEVGENDDCLSHVDESNGRFSCSNVHEDEAAKEPEEHSQFYISLELPKPESNIVKEELPPEGGYSSFFKGVKRLLSSPKRKAASPVNVEHQSDREKTEVLNDRNKQETSHSAKNLEGMLSNGKQPYSPQMSDCHDIFKPNPAEIIDETSGLRRLPGPHEFGSGNPFLLFICVTLFLQHRDHIMRNQMDYDELAMYFDKMVRKHNVHKVLQQARQLYSDYLRDQQQLQIDRESYGLSV